MRSRLWMAVLLALALAGLPAVAGAEPASAGPPPRATTATAGDQVFVGRVAGSRAHIGLSLKEGQLIAYLCDGDAPRNRRQTVSEWFRGAVAGQAIQLRSRRGARLTARLVGDRIVGTVRLAGGRGLSFVAQRARGTGRFLIGALPFTRSGRLVAGWIRLPGGAERGTYLGPGSVNCNSLYLSARDAIAIGSDLLANRLLGEFARSCVLRAS